MIKAQSLQLRALYYIQHKPTNNAATPCVARPSAKNYVLLFLISKRQAGNVHYHTDAKNDESTES